MLNILKNLVNLDTTNSKKNETKCANYLKKLLSPYANKIELIGDKQKNIIAYFGNLNSRQALLLNGHLDVVQANPKNWQTNPFCLTIKENKAYGRGTADMKGGIAIILDAIIRAKNDGLLNNKLVIFAGTVDEESGADSNLGAKMVAKHLKDNNIDILGCIIPEPISPENKTRFNLGHRGLMWIKAKSHGKKSHSGLCNIEDNAILNLMNFIFELKIIIPNQPTKINNLPNTSCRIIHINSQAQDVFNVVPDVCECNLDVRVSPLEKNKKVYEKIQKLAKKHNIDLTLIKNTNSQICSENKKLVKKVQQAFKNLNEPYVIGYASPTCDAHWFSEQNIPTINGLGATGHNVHSDNEYILIDSLNIRSNLFYEIIKIW